LPVPPVAVDTGFARVLQRWLTTQERSGAPRRHTGHEAAIPGPGEGAERLRVQERRHARRLGGEHLEGAALEGVVLDEIGATRRDGGDAVMQALQVYTTGTVEQCATKRGCTSEQSLRSEERRV